MKTKLLVIALSAITNFCIAQQKTKIPLKKSISNSTSTVKQAEPEIKPVVAEPGKEVVAIYPFTSASGCDYSYAQSVGNAIESGFVRSVRFNVVERSRFGSISLEERFKEANTTSVVKLQQNLVPNISSLVL